MQLKEMQSNNSVFVSFGSLLLCQFVQCPSIVKHVGKQIQSLFVSLAYDVTAIATKSRLNSWDSVTCEVGAVSLGLCESSCCDFMLSCRFWYCPTELWKWTRWSPPANHPFTCGSGERCVCESASQSQAFDL